MQGIETEPTSTSKSTRASRGHSEKRALFDFQRTRLHRALSGWKKRTGNLASVEVGSQLRKPRGLDSLQRAQYRGAAFRCQPAPGDGPKSLQTGPLTRTSPSTRPVRPARGRISVTEIAGTSGPTEAATHLTPPHGVVAFRARSGPFRRDPGALRAHSARFTQRPRPAESASRPTPRVAWGIACATRAGWRDSARDRCVKAHVVRPLFMRSATRTTKP